MDVPHRSKVAQALALLLVIAGAAATAGCAKSPPRPNVLLVIVDTLRSDRLGCMGSGSGLTPNMDALAAEGVLFENAFCHAPWTLPSVASLLTSTYPAQHQAGGQLSRFTRLDGAARTVGECFQDAGYRTVAIVNVEFLTEAFGLTKGFDRVDFVQSEGNSLTRIAGQTTTAALQWLRTLCGRPFLLVVHYFDPHLVYEPPAEFRRSLALAPDREGNEPVFGTIPEIVAYRRGQIELGDETIRRLEALYNGEVAYTDRELGRLLDGLKEMKLDSSTIIVVTSDHGEEFLDHGGFEHGHTLYDELIHVPLIIRWPGHIPANVVARSEIRHVDVAPTVCSLTGVPADAGFRGRDLAPLWAPDAPRADRPVYGEGNFWGAPLYCRRANGYKTIMQEGSDKVEIYDLSEDPGEMTTLGGDDPLLVKRLTEDLALIRMGMGVDTPKPAPVSLTPREKERLRALGYGY